MKKKLVALAIAAQLALTTVGSAAANGNANSPAGHSTGSCAPHCAGK